MTRAQMRHWDQLGSSYLQILNAAIRDGDEFPDAFSRMIWEFNLDDEEAWQLRNEYDEQEIGA